MSGILHRTTLCSLLCYGPIGGVATVVVSTSWACVAAEPDSVPPSVSLSLSTPSESTGFPIPLILSPMKLGVEITRI